MDEFDIGNLYADTDYLDHAIFPNIEEFDGKEVREAFSSSHELSKTFYTSYDEKRWL